MPTKELPVVGRGSFFDDAFFKDSWEDFDAAMQRVIHTFDQMRSHDSRPQCQDAYRQIRTNQMGDDASQAVHVTEKDGRFQVVMDVRDFNPRDLQVRVVDEKIVIEGRYDQVSEDAKSSTSKAFYKEFVLPPAADIDQVSTALSKDGVLTIKAPRKEGYVASESIQNNYNSSATNNIGPVYNSPNNFDTLSYDLKDRLKLSDRDSGRSTASGSPFCMSPTLSETESEASRSYSAKVPGHNSPYIAPQPPQPAFSKVQGPFSPAPSGTYTPQSGTFSPQPPSGMFSPPPGTFSPQAPSGTFSPQAPSGTFSPQAPSGTFSPQAPGTFSPPPSGPFSPTASGTFSPTPSSAFSPAPSGVFSPTPPGTFAPISEQRGSFQSPQPSFNSQQHAPFTMAKVPQRDAGQMNRVNRPAGTPAVGSGGTATISVQEQDGKRTMTQETSSVVQEKDGFLESKEIAAEVTAKDSQAARREAVTRMMKQEDDPQGRFKKSETADASDISESCVQQMPDGSVMTVKKSSTSSSNVKKSFSSSSGDAIDPNFPMAFGTFPSMMRGNPLMPQYSSDSLSSGTSYMSNFSNRSSNMQSRFPEMSANFPDMPGFGMRSQFRDMNEDMTARFPFSSRQQFPTNQQSSTSSSSSQSSFQQSSSNSFDSRKF